MTFKKTSESKIEAFDITLEEHEHIETGAKWFHLRSENQEKCFLVGFPTHPTSSDGSAHILEHLSLCGSKSFPAKDPFFNMSRRSLATFMNAMTYPDRTVYPFATMIDKDFKNLASVYLDATFFPNLNELDFLQEGWRLERDEIGEDGSPLKIKGIVYNEMKGVLSDPTAILWYGAQSTLFRNSTYQWNSGGEPASIPTLTLEKLRDFHAKHYHPSNAIFMTFGDIDLKEMQDFVEERVLSKFDRSENGMARASIPAIDRLETVEMEIPGCGEEESEFQFMTGWRMGSQSDLKNILRSSYLGSLLFGDASAPMMTLMKTAGFGRAGDLCGGDSSGAEATMWMGMQGLKENEIEKAKALLFGELERLAKEGFSREREISVLRDFELSAREIKGNGQPFGLSLMLKSMPSAIHGGSVSDSLNFGELLDELAKEVENGGVGASLTKALLENTQRVDFKIKPVADWTARLAEKEALLVESLTKNLSSEDVQELDRQAIALKERQSHNHGVDLLPTLDPSDIPEKPLKSVPLSFEKGKAISASLGTNGVVYVDVFREVETRDPEALRRIDFLMSIADGLGAGSLSFDKAGEKRSIDWAGLSAGLAVSSHINGATTIRLEASGKTLQRNLDSGLESLRELIESPRFDEEDIWLHLLEENRQDMEASLGSSGRTFANLEATAAFSEASAIKRALSGVPSIDFAREISRMAKEEGVRKVAELCQEAFKATLNGRGGSFIVSDPSIVSAFASKLGGMFGSSLERGTVSESFPTATLSNKILVGPSEVSYCAMALRAPRLADNPEAAAAMSLAAAAMTNGFLHRTIREEGGAYGGGASSDAVEGVLLLSSYRDPRLAGTFADFGRAMDWFVSSGPSEREWHEARLSCLQRETPKGPRGEAARALERIRAGFSEDMRMTYRKALLNVSLSFAKETLAKVMEGAASRAAFCGENHLGEADALGMTQKRLTQEKRKKGLMV